ncbi:MAG: sigma-54-dependent Fis family transcriptional regulator [Rhodocyclaceae bacterium]|nr:MAG: sigma-54-dependent Fis family transcriptional regulator [Rhodocyclaceae bacterium]
MSTIPPQKAKPFLLIVDDDPLIAETLSFILQGDFEVITADSRPSAIALVRQAQQAPGLALIDLGLPPLPHRPDEGFALIRELLAHDPDIRIVVLSGQNDESNARHARALGATDFVAKPADPDHIKRVLLDALSFRLTDAAQAESTDCKLLGNSPPIQKLRLQLQQYADSPFPILIEGESGSGKEIAASCCLHLHSERRNKPYFALNCAAISPSLVEPTLFGYAKGAFTGATGNKSGYFEDAGDGTLFLDEIGELPLELQAKLLRVLENGEFQRVGETQTRRSRARVIAATNRDLRKEVREGRFRGDLYHRLSVFTVSVPPLREMGSDRLLLLEHFRRQYAQTSGRPAFRLSPGAEQAWLEYPFPGNVRELRNIVIRLTAKYPGMQVEPDVLADEFDEQSSPTESLDGANWFDIALHELQTRGGVDLDETLRRWEQAYVDAAQQLAKGNITQAARLLGINRTTLYNRIETLARNKPQAKQH